MSVAVTYYRNRNENDTILLAILTEEDPTINVYSLAEVDADSPDDFSNGWNGFTGWNTARDGSGTSYAAGDTLSSNTTLYAIWYEPQKYVVKETQLTAIADAIREKTGGSASLEFPDGFTGAIEGITGRYANENMIVPINTRVPSTSTTQTLFGKASGYNYFGYHYVSSSTVTNFSMTFIPLFDLEAWFHNAPNTKFTLQAGKQYSYNCAGYVDSSNQNQSVYETIIVQNSPYTTICDSESYKVIAQSQIDFRKKVD